MAALQGTEIVDIAIEDAVKSTKEVSEVLYNTAKVFFS
jgi:hypothetical protein